MKIILPHTINEELSLLSEELKQLKTESILKLIIEGVDDPGILKCVFLAGGPGSGKSHMASVLFGVAKKKDKKNKDKEYVISFSHSGLKSVNSDTAFERELKKYGIDTNELANIEKNDPDLWDMITNGKNSIRTRAKDLTRKQQNFYEAGRLGLIIDGTGKDYNKIKKQKDRAEEMGYDTYMLFVNTSLEVALERNENRDRVLPESLVRSTWKDVQQNMGKFQGLFGSNSFTIVDNTKYGPPPTKIQKEINRFMSEPLKNPIGKKWVNTARELKNRNLIK